MTKRDKLRKKLRNNPNNVKHSDLETLLMRFGFVLLRVKGSHHFYQYLDDTRNEIAVVPVHGNEVKSRYVRDAMALLDSLFPEGEADESDEESDDE
jgi:predicted RNA binding protein YcfA (HicA-like mRNA interferase family)